MAQHFSRWKWWVWNPQSWEVMVRYFKRSNHAGQYTATTITIPPTHPFNQQKKWNNKNARWFNVTFSSPIWRSLCHVKGSLNYPKKVTKDCQMLVFLPIQKGDAPNSLHCLLCTSSKVLAAATAAGLCAPLRSTNLWTSNVKGIQHRRVELMNGETTTTARTRKTNTICWNTI